MSYLKKIEHLRHYLPVSRNPDIRAPEYVMDNTIQDISGRVLRELSKSRYGVAPRTQKAYSTKRFPLDLLAEFERGGFFRTYIG